MATPVNYTPHVWRFEEEEGAIEILPGRLNEMEAGITACADAANALTAAAAEAAQAWGDLAASAAQIKSQMGIS